MPLTRATVTVGNRIMLPIFVIFFAGVGMNYLLTPRIRLIASPSLNFADRLMPLHAWGTLFLAAAILMLAAMVRSDRTWFRFAQLVCVVAVGGFTLAGIVAPFFTDASPGGWLYPGFITATVLASYRSLSSNEVG